MNEKRFARDLAAVLALLQRQGRPVRAEDLARRRAPKQRRERKPRS